MSRYIKGLYNKTERVLNENESLAAKAAALLGVTEEDIAGTVEGLTFSDYLALGNAIDVEDVEDANRILGIDGMEESAEEPVVEAGGFFGGGGFNAKHIAQANKEALAKKRAADALQKKLDKQEWDRKHKPKKVQPDLWKIAQIIMDEVGNAVPDGDPIDLIVPKVARMLGMGGRDPWDHPSAWDVVPILDKAARKHLGVKNYNEYLANMWDSYAEIMPPEERDGWENPWRTNEGINEADNPYVTPPSAGLPSKNLNKGQATQDKGEELARSKDVDDLMFGDEIEVADIDGQPSPAKVIMPKGPGNTVAVRGKGGVDVMVKKDSIIGTPKINEATWGSDEWDIEDHSKISRGADPTYITNIHLKRRDGHYLELTEFFGDWYIVNHTEGGRTGHMTEQQVEQYLKEYSAPSLDQIADYIERTRSYGDAENGPSARDLEEAYPPGYQKGIWDTMRDIKKNDFERSREKIYSGENTLFGKTVYNSQQFFDTDKFRGQREYEKEFHPEAYKIAYERYLKWKAAQQAPVNESDDEKFEAQKQYDYHKRQYERLVKSQGWHGGVSGTEVYNRDWKKEAAQHKREAAKYKKLAGINETATGGATGAGAIATAPAATGGVQKRNPSIYGKPEPKQKKKKEDGIGRNRKQ